MKDSREEGGSKKYLTNTEGTGKFLDELVMILNLIEMLFTIRYNLYNLKNKKK